MMDKPNHRKSEAKESAPVEAPPLLPPPTLPKGGGAIHGIGEKFSTNAATGTSALVVPLPSSPGRAGFQLGLSLDYDSGAGNGPFGLGWRLSAPSITRKTDRGLPRYLDDESDVFVLAGAEDLVPVPFVDVDGTVCDEGRRTVGDAVYRVRRYLPRVSGEFSRIERWTAVDGDVHWRTLSKDNVLSIYGRSECARIVGPPEENEPARVFAWLIEETRDDRGNAVHYLHAPEDDRGIDRERPSEAHRFVRRGDGTTKFLGGAQRYLKRVRYANRIPIENRESALPADENAWLLELVFDYGDHDDDAPTPTPTRAWTTREDPFSSARAGFEIRTYRLCRRVLMFHRFAELGTEPCLVRSLDFTHAADPIATHLTAITHAGYVRNGGAYTRATMPPLELTYAERTLHDEVVALDPTSLEGIALGVEGGAQWIDLDGEGIPGVLVREPAAFFYKENLGAGRFGPPHLEGTIPIPSEPRGSGAQLMDLGGDGNLDFVQYTPPFAGYSERTTEREWAPFSPLPNAIAIDWTDPNLRFVDVDGDGFPDVLITERDELVWYRSRAKEGFERRRSTRKPRDERDGPAIVFADGTETIQLADMTGDGLTDLVRIRNGEVSYWPNLGHGRFGRKVTLDDSPWFDAPAFFAPSRVHLADVDGSGTADVLYMGRDGVRIYFNASGNSLSEPAHVDSLPPMDLSATITTVDLLGQGTSCLVWSSATGTSPRHVLYVDLLGGRKPYLLEKVVNNLGAETRITYASSSKFYLQDKLAGRPWLTRLSFPVHVVERVDHEDLVSRSRLVTRFAYHHGYFDGYEREFRGFARVEQWDTETADALSQGDLPPMRTVTWFHTGALLERERLERALAREYYGGAWQDGSAPAQDYFGRDTRAQDPKAAALLLPDTIFDADGGGPFALDDERQACRALRGKTLRQEIYAEDGSAAADHPYSVSERSFAVRRLHPATHESDGVFLVHPRETIDCHYERGYEDAAGQWRNDDPRIEHEVVLSVDDFGTATQTAKLAYPRRRPLPDMPEQSALWATITTRTVVNRPFELDWSRVATSVESTSSELMGLPAPQNEVFGFDELAAAAARPQTIRRVFEAQRQIYYRDYDTVADYEADAAGPLPLGEITSRAIVHETYRRALTASLATEIYGATFDLATLASEGHYASFGDDVFWAPSGRVVPDPAKFYLPAVAFDPRHTAARPARSVLIHDGYHLMAVEQVDPVGNRIVVGTRRSDGTVSHDGNDYRVLSASLVCDANRCRSRVAFDALGLVSKLWRMGRVEEVDVGDDDARPGVEFRYDLDAWRRGVPASAHVATRVKHRGGGDAFSSAGEPNRVGFRHLRVYSDGLGREVMTKVQAEPGPAPRLDAAGGVQRAPDGTPLTDDEPNRWIGTGRVIFDNKGNRIKTYEPFYSKTIEFEDASALVEWGVGTVKRYDPLGRLVRADLPNQTFSRIVTTPWRTESWDENDTSPDSGWHRLWSRAPASPLGLPTFLSLLTPPWTTTPSDLERAGWLSMLLCLDPPTAADLAWLGTQTGPVPAIWAACIARALDQKRAASLAGAHASTPSLQHLDALGRVFLEVADRGHEVAAAERRVVTRIRLNVQGSQLTVTDAKGNVGLEQVFDDLQRAIRVGSADAGTGRTLFDVANQPIRAWDARDIEVGHEYDAAGRPTSMRVRAPGNPHGRIVTRTVYGEGSPRDEELGRRGRPYQVYDGAGLATREAFDINGNSVQMSRRLLRDFRTGADWPDDAAATAALLEGEVFFSRATYDATNHVTSRTAPDQDGRVTSFGYDQGGLLTSIAVAAPAEPPALVVRDITYNARGQRTKISCGNGTETLYSYDAETFRLVGQVTRSASQSFQDRIHTHDPVGNVVSIRDAVSWGNPQISADALYEYDALYQLSLAAGREHPGQQPSEVAPAIHPNDAQALRRYSETYDYDLAGNLRAISHALVGDTSTGWRRAYMYEGSSNRLVATSAPGDPDGTVSARYTHDAAGNVATMPHLSLLEWDHASRLAHARRQSGGPANDVYFSYDNAGNRVRKVYEHAGVLEERIYIEGWEIYRKRAEAPASLLHERQTLHVFDDRHRVALLERETADADTPGFQESTRIRYQVADHLGSCSMELDASGAVISYCEYHPYGTNAFTAQAPSLEVNAGQYGYNGKERDEETSFHYYGARYYAAWLGRWTGPDPAGLVDGNNRFAYVRNNPVRFVDPSGRAADILDDLRKTYAAAAEVMSQYNTQLRAEQYMDHGAGKDLKDVHWSFTDSSKNVNANGIDAFAIVTGRDANGNAVIYQEYVDAKSSTKAKAYNESKVTALDKNGSKHIGNEQNAFLNKVANKGGNVDGLDAALKGHTPTKVVEGYGSVKGISAQLQNKGFDYRPGFSRSTAEAGERLAELTQKTANASTTATKATGKLGSSLGGRTAKALGKTFGVIGAIALTLGAVSKAEAAVSEAKQGNYLGAADAITDMHPMLADVKEGGRALMAGDYGKAAYIAASNLPVVGTAIGIYELGSIGVDLAKEWLNK